MRPIIALACALLGAGGAALADTDFTDLSEQERAAMRAEIRALLLSEPDIVARALAGPSPYSAAIDRDLGLIDRYAGTLFADGAAVAIFIDGNCPDCDRALNEIRDVTDDYRMDFNVLNMSDHADIAQALELDTVPSYVFPDKMVRGHVPPIVLERYLQK